MSYNEIEEKINAQIESDDTENFYSLISEIIEENKDLNSELEKILTDAFIILSNDINLDNYEKKLSFICLFFEILISENIDFSKYLQDLLSMINQQGINSDDNIKRIINICSNATINKKILFNNLIQFSKDKIEYLYIIFSLAGFKDVIVNNLSDNWEFIIDLLDNPNIKSNSNSIKNLLKCLEILINLCEKKFKPYASSALYQALDYLTETDVELQKRSLMIIYSLTKFCNNELKPLSENIIDFLKVLQNGNDIEINNLCNTMLKHFNEQNENENENEKVNEDNNANQNLPQENEEIFEDNNNIINNDNENYINNLEQNENENENENRAQEYVDNENERAKENENENESEHLYDNNEVNYDDNNNDHEEEEKDDKHLNILRNNYVQEERVEKDNEDEEEIIEQQEVEINKGLKEDEKDDNEDEEEENKYNYIKEKEEKDNGRNNEPSMNNNNNNNLNNIDINAIIKKIKDLSDKQIIILDSIEQYKRDTKRIINQKKLKIQSLEAKIEDLKEKIRIEKNKKRNKTGKTNYQFRRKKMNENKNQYNDEDDYDNDDNQYNNNDYEY